MEITNIYTLSDPRDNKVRYVGKTNNLGRRYKAHLVLSREIKSHKKSWIKQLKILGLKPVMEVIDVVPISEWVFWESYWINQLKGWGFKLVNHTYGGEGSTFGNSTSFKKGNIPWNKGTAKPKNKSKYKVGKHHNCIKNQFVKGNVPWNKGKKLKLKPDKNVFQYEKGGRFIKKWSTAKTAALELGLNEDAIGQCCRGKSKSSGGFIWKYN